MLISLIDQFPMFNGWMNSRADPRADPGFFVRGGVPGPTARIQDPHMGPARTYTHTHTHTHTHIHTYIGMYRDRHMNVHAQADG